MVKSKIILVLVAVFLFSSVAPSLSFAESEPKVTEEQLQKEHEDFEEVKPILAAIEKIPEKVVAQGPEKTAEWLQKETGYFVTVDSKQVLQFSKVDPNTRELEIRSFNSWACIGAIGVALVSNGIPFTKILKVKAAIKALGGVSKTVSKVKKYYDEYRFNGFSRNDSIRKALDSASDGLAADTKSALLDFFNLSAVIGSCFS
ncbi:hypothetical protein [Rossellomorea sp. BNER]|uniref:hypothetical protein n=1 Tax=Rossellomorea sp. BNER TaxID=2962031 RepID=UPI003AF25DCA|nr:hypothetical protein [Rossellomorea sp. BNER]